MSTTGRHRRTSLSSNASGRSSWRVPSVKQPPRTQLSAVFAESSPSRSPSHQSAQSILESRLAASPSTGSSTGVADSPTSVRATPISAVSSPVGLNDTENALNITEGIAGSASRRGRQSTQRHLSLIGDSATQVNPVSAPPDSQSRQQTSMNVILDVSSSSSTSSTAAQTATLAAVDPQSTRVQENLATTQTNEKRKQSSMMSGWFGSSGRAKSRKLVPPEEPILPEGGITPSLIPTTEPPVVSTPTPVPLVVDTPTPSATTKPPEAASGWFSRSKTATPVAPPTPSNTIPVESPKETVVAPLESTTIAVPPAPETVPTTASSPARQSWFGMRVRSTPQPQSTSTPASLHSTPLSQVVDLPPDNPMSDSVMDEAMAATITPMSFAQAQAQAQSSRAAVPTLWFKGSGKRGSMAPSVDSTVPSLPPSPKKEPQFTTLIPVANSSVYSVGSSSARYSLSLPFLGRPTIKVEDAIRVMEVTGASTDGATVTKTVMETEVREIEMIIEPEPQTSAVASSSASTTSSHHPPPSRSWWPSLGRSGGVTQAPQISLTPAEITPIEAAPSIIASSASSTHDQEPSKELQFNSEQRMQTERVPDTATWFGFWPWGGAPGEPIPQKTEAELIKEQAMARDNEPLVSPTVVPDLPTPRPSGEQNPISVDATENRSSWISFFSLRAAHGAKQITVAGETEDVMDLDGDPNAPPDAPPEASDHLTMAKKGKGPQPTSPVGAPKPRSSSTGPALKRDPINPPLTDSESLRRKVTTSGKRSSSATPSKRSLPPSTPSKAPNMVLPTFEDTFYTLPRALPPHTRPTPLRKVGRIVSGVFGISGIGGTGTPSRNDEMRMWQDRAGVSVPKDYEGLRAARDVGRDLPRVGEVLGVHDIGRIKDCKRVAIIGVHGWFPGTIMRTLFGEPTGTSPKFASMMEAAVLEFMEKQGNELEKVTLMPLEGDGTIEKRVEKLYQDFLKNSEWVEDLHEADVVFVATHSQGSVVSTQLLEKLIADGHLRTSKNWEIIKTVAETPIGAMSVAPPRPPQKVCCLALCGIHLGPLLYLGTSSIVNPYIQYFESAAAKELFEFQDTESEVSKKYLASLEIVLDHGVKFVYVASLDDQVVPIYSGIFTAVNHPRILRALYIDGDAYSSSDFLSNLLVLLLRLRNAGIDDGGLLTHLSEATAGSLNGIGHSTAYADPGGYRLAVRFLFETSDALGDEPKLEFEPFTAKASRNDYEIPWALRGLIADPRCQELFGKELAELRNAFDSWQPKTSALKDVRRKLEPIRGRRSRFAPDPYASISSPISFSQSPTVDKR